MANNDMEVIMYKILKYLYCSMIHGVKPLEEDFCCNGRIFGHGIPPYTWSCVMQELEINGYIRGLKTVETKNGSLLDASDVIITYAGRQFLNENSGMKKAAEYLGSAFETILSGVVEALTVSVIK